MPRRSLLEYFDNFHDYGSEAAYVHRRGYRTVRWSYREVAEAASQFARELESKRIAKGDHVLIWGENCAEWVAAFFGCVLRGAVVVPMDRIASPDFSRRVAEQVDAKLVVCSGDLRGHFAQLPTLPLEDLRAAIAGHDSTAYPDAPVDRSDVLEVVFTSGTTADPKGVVLTHGNILANLETFEPEIRKYLKYEWPFHPIRFLNLLPLSHVFGQFLGLFIPQLIRGTVLFQDSLNPSEVIRTIKAERVSVLVAVPRMLESLKEKIERDFEAEGKLEWFRQRLEDSASVGFVRRWWRFRKIHNRFGWKFWAFISGGAALDRATEEFWRRLSFVVIQGYGLTETTSLISVNHPFKLGRGSIGKVLPGREIKLAEDGEIMVRGESIASGYWQGRELRPVRGEEGWFRTGDLGERDADGNLYFKGRKKEVIVNPEGMNIYPEDLEAALRRQPEIRDAVVVGLARKGNAEPCAAVILAAGENSGEQAIQRANQSLAQYQQIRSWFVWPEADFPRTSTNKVRAALVQQIAQQRMGTQPAAQPGSGALQELIARVTKRAAPATSPDAELDGDLNLSSIDRVELVSALEDRYQVDLSDESIAEVKSIGDLEKVVRESAPRQTQFEYPSWAQRWPHTWIRTIIYYLLTWPATLLLVNPRVYGRENLRGFRGPALVISNHVTYLDIGFILWALPARLRNRLATAMGGEILMLMRYPPRTMNLFQRFIERLSYRLMVPLFNVFPLPQRSGFRESFAFAGKLIDQGYNVLVFPEGGRTENGEMRAFRSGIGLLATRLNVPVIPMRIDGLFELKQKKKRFAPGKVSVKIGAPIRIDPKQAPEAIAAELERRVASL
jgi:long-chain acyl-CoA synthetase